MDRREIILIRKKPPLPQPSPETQRQINILRQRELRRIQREAQKRRREESD